jgi:UDP-3-O-[3-hydroxymyristoyl] glucosamine N-acyltransferase
VDGEVRGDAERPVAGIRDLASAGPGDLAPFFHRRYLEQGRTSRAGVLLTGRDGELRRTAEALGKDLLLADDPPYALARLLEVFYPPQTPPAGVHPTAAVDPTAQVAPTAHLGPYVVVGAESRVEDGAVLEAHTVVGRRCRVGAGSRLHPHVVLYDDTELGLRVEVHSGTVLGGDGFGYAFHGGAHHKVPQVGRVVVEDDVEIGANTAVDRAALGATRIGAGSKIDNLVQVGHNVEIGRAAILCGQVGVAGSSHLGDGVVLAGRSGVSGHLTVGDGVQIAADSVALRSVEAGEKVAGTPAVPLAQWRRQVVMLPRLQEMERRLRALEKLAKPEKKPKKPRKGPAEDPESHGGEEKGS